jgi:CRP-like cAMP-binding protein
MNHLISERQSDIEKLRRLKIFSSFNSVALRVLRSSLAMSNYRRREVISRLDANEAHVLISGTARITCLNASNQRVTVALIAPGPVPELSSLPVSRFDCEAYSDCRVGTLDWKAFDSIIFNGREWAFQKFHQNDLKLWYRVLRRSSGLLDIDLHERVALTMLDLCDDFGVEDSRGTLLTISCSHKDIASIVGASRPRVTEHLGQMERDHLLIRQGRQFIVAAGKLSSFLAQTA